MAELDGLKFNIKQVNFSGVSKAAPEVQKEETVETDRAQLSDFSDNKAEALGRSQVFKGSTDNVNNDLKALLNNPEIAENSDKMFEASYSIAKAKGLDNAYEVAADLSTTNM